MGLVKRNSDNTNKNLGKTPDETKSITQQKTAAKQEPNSAATHDSLTNSSTEYTQTHTLSKFEDSIVIIKENTARKPESKVLTERE